MSDHGAIEFEFTGAIWHWRGPAPYYFVTVPEEESAYLEELKSALTYGWGVIPVRAQVGDTEWTTSLFPKDGAYALPVKDAVRRAEGLEEGSVISVSMSPTRTP